MAGTRVPGGFAGLGECEIPKNFSKNQYPEYPEYLFYSFIIINTKIENIYLKYYKTEGIEVT